jgi:uncharacterized RDD family membrane protein YckC
MTAARMQAFVSLLLALLIAMLVAVVEGGAVARADTPAAHSDTRSDAASAAQNDWEQDSSSRDRAESAERADASDDEDDDADTREEAQDRRSVEEYFDWDSDWRHPFGRRHLRHDRHTRSDDLVNFGRDSDLPAGAHADSVVSIFGSVSNEGDAENLVAIVGDTKASGHVKDSAVAVLGNVQIDGPVDGDVVAVFGNVDLGPHAQVGGDVTVVGGGVHRDPAAIVRGGVQSVGGFTSGFDHFRPWVKHCLLYCRPLALEPGIGWAWGLAFIFLALYVFVALLFRDAVSRCADTVEAQPGMALVAALLSILLIPIAVVLLCITVIGVAAIPFVLFGAFCVGLFGKAVMLAWLGRRVVGRSGRLGHPAIAVIVGGLIVLALYLIPVLGFLVYNVLGLLGFGAVVYTLILAGRVRRATRPATVPHAGPTPGGAVPPGSAVPPGGTVPPGSTVPPAGTVPPGATASPGGTVPGPIPAAAAAAGGAAVGGERPAAAAAPGAGSPGHFIDPALAATLPRAGFWIRMVALLLDLLLVGILMSMLHHSHDLELVVLAIYGALMWKLRGTTVGGLVFHLQVVRVDGRPINWETAIVRALSCFLSMVVVGLGFFWIAFDSGKQGWHDKIAGTAVVRVPRAMPLV